MPRNLLRVLLITAPFLFMANASLAVETPMTMGELLARLESAEREGSFRGQYTREHGGTIDTFDIVRVVVNGMEFERTSRLSGPQREKISVGRDTRCLTKSNHLLRGHHLNLKVGGAVSIEQSYNFYFLGEDRIAGRLASVIRIEPKDPYRYGYWLSIDKDTGLIVRSVITSGKKKAVERAQYVSLESLPDEVDLLELLGEESYAELQAQLAEGANQDACDLNVKFGSPWRPAWVPPGFLLTSYIYTEKDGHMETYSDGLGSFSVFVNENQNGLPQSLRAQKGATVIYMASEQEKQISVVGEVPLVSAQKVAASISSRREP